MRSRLDPVAWPAVICCIVVAGPGSESSEGQERPAPVSTRPVSEPDQPTAPTEIPPGRETYFGRQIAQTMHYLGAEWLIRDTREREERCSLMLANLGLKRGMTVCDMGCGNGFHALQMARIVGPQGKVLAVDIQPEMLDLLRQRMKEEEITNISPILGAVHDPRLPRGKLDLILLVDVYHEFSHPEFMLRAMRESLAPEGVIVLVEFRAEDPQVPIKRLHKMSKAQIMKEVPPNGFQLVKQFDRLPWQHMMFFGKDSTPPPLSQDTGDRP